MWHASQTHAALARPFTQQTLGPGQLASLPLLLAGTVCWLAVIWGVQPTAVRAQAQLSPLLPGNDLVHF